MRDWKQLVRARLSGLELPAREKEDVVVELAGHLEEKYAQLCVQGISTEEAVEECLEQVSDWREFTKKIQSAKKGDSMNIRTRTLWLPGILTLTVSMGFLLVLQFSRIQPHAMVWPNRGPILLFYIPWLVSLPAFGALGAFLSLRAGGSRRAVLLSGVFPAVYPATCFFVILPLAIIFNRNVALHFSFLSLLPQLLVWLILPTTALFIGGFALLAANRGHLAPTKVTG
jgi:hypothetical protein